MEELKRLISHLSRFPGIGKKTAERIAFFILKMEEMAVRDFIAAILAWRKSAKLCPVCFNITSKERCEICEDQKRDKTAICVVEDVSDLFAIETTNSYRGLYHILGGTLTTEETKKTLRISELKERVKDGNIKEVIIATNPTTEGDLTAAYLAKVLKSVKSGIKVSRIARGIPFGSNIELADSITISQAIAGRKEI